MLLIQTPQIIQLPKIQDPRGNLTFVQNGGVLPFEIKRVFWIYDVPGGETRGGHANRTQQELIIAISGSFDVVVTDKAGVEQRFHLNRSYFGLYLPPMQWRSLDNFSTNSVALHLCSTPYNEQDYFRDFTIFKTT